MELIELRKALMTRPSYATSLGGRCKQMLTIAFVAKKSRRGWRARGTLRRNKQFISRAVTQAEQHNLLRIPTIQRAQ